MATGGLLSACLLLRLMICSVARRGFFTGESDWLSESENPEEEEEFDSSVSDLPKGRFGLDKLAPLLFDDLLGERKEKEELEEDEDEDESSRVSMGTAFSLSVEEDEPEEFEDEEETAAASLAWNTKQEELIRCNNI